MGEREKTNNSLLLPFSCFVFFVDFVFSCTLCEAKPEAVGTSQRDLVDPPASDDNIAIVEDDRLPGSDGGLGLVERDTHSTGVEWIE
jgi:hypothetical protein